MVIDLSSPQVGAMPGPVPSDPSDKDVQLSYVATEDGLLRELGLCLIASCDKGDKDEVTRLLEHKEKDRFINQRDEVEESALFKAAKRGHFEIVQLLVHHGVDVNSTQNLGNVQLSYVATEHGQTKQLIIDLSSAQVGTISLG